MGLNVDILNAPLEFQIAERHVVKGDWMKTWNQFDVGRHQIDRWRHPSGEWSNFAEVTRIQIYDEFQLSSRSGQGSYA